MATNELIRNDYDLYYNGRVLIFDDGSAILTRDLIEYKSQQSDQWHTVMQTDTITYLAWYYYSKYSDTPSRYWKYIADVNNITNPLDLSEYVGKDILIPDWSLIRLNEE